MVKTIVVNEEFIVIPKSMRGILLKGVSEIDLISLEKEKEVITLKFKII